MLGVRRHLRNGAVVAELAPAPALDWWSFQSIVELAVEVQQWGWDRRESVRQALATSNRPQTQLQTGSVVDAAELGRLEKTRNVPSAVSIDSRSHCRAANHASWAMLFVLFGAENEPTIVSREWVARLDHERIATSSISTTRASH